MLDKATGTAIAQNVAHQVEGVVVRMLSVAFVEGHVKRIHRDIPFNNESSFFGLLRLFGKISRLYIPTGNWTKPFLGQCYGFFERDIACNGKDGVVRGIEAEKEILNLIESGVFDVCRFFADGRPLVRMGLVGEVSHQMSHIAVRLVQIALLELFNDHMALYFQALFAEIEGEHAVAFQPESRFCILLGQGDVVIGDVVVGPCIVLASRILDMCVVVGDVDGTSEHQVFEQMCETCVFGVFITGTHIIQHIDGYHTGRLVFAMYDAEAVVKYLPIDGYHSNTVIFRIRMFSFGRSALPVGVPSIFSTVSIPSITCPNTV